RRGGGVVGGGGVGRGAGDGDDVGDDRGVGGARVDVHHEREARGGREGGNRGDGAAHRACAADCWDRAGEGWAAVLGERDEGGASRDEVAQRDALRVAGPGVVQVDGVGDVLAGGDRIRRIAVGHRKVRRAAHRGRRG